MSDFLKNLQKSVDSGEFNSDAAKQINELLKKSEDVDLNNIDKVMTLNKEDGLKRSKPTDEDIKKAETEYNKYITDVDYEARKSAEMNSVFNKYFSAIDGVDEINSKISMQYLNINDIDAEYNKLINTYPDMVSHFENVLAKKVKVIDMYMQFINKYKEYISGDYIEIINNKE